MRNRRLLRIGIVGTVIAALCCFTPVFVVLLGAVGLSAAVGWLDYVLLPALAVFVGITVSALVRRQRVSSCESTRAREGTWAPGRSGSDRTDGAGSEASR